MEKAIAFLLCVTNLLDMVCNLGLARKHSAQDQPERVPTDLLCAAVSGVTALIALALCHVIALRDKALDEEEEGEED